MIIDGEFVDVFKHPRYCVLSILKDYFLDGNLDDDDFNFLVIYVSKHMPNLVDSGLMDIYKK